MLYEVITYTGAGQQGLDAGILDDGGSQATLVNHVITSYSIHYTKLYEMIVECGKQSAALW